jgi:hypothetical protein
MLAVNRLDFFVHAAVMCLCIVLALLLVKAVVAAAFIREG